MKVHIPMCPSSVCSECPCSKSGKRDTEKSDGRRHRSQDLQPTLQPANQRMMQTILMRINKNYFYTDIMARGQYPSYTERMFSENNIHIVKEEGDDELLANNTVNFLAFSYYMSGWLFYRQQL